MCCNLQEFNPECQVRWCMVYEDERNRFPARLVPTNYGWFRHLHTYTTYVGSWWLFVFAACVGACLTFRRYELRHLPQQDVLQMAEQESSIQSVMHLARGSSASVQFRETTTQQCAAFR
jgi:hypothetical protein